MPLIAEFQFTREIEDRLLAPMEISWVAVEKVLAGTLKELVAGLVVIPLAWVILRPGVSFSLRSPLTFTCVTALVALLRERWARPGLQRQSDPYRIDVQHGTDADDLLWVYVLPLERAQQFPHPAKGGADQSAVLCQLRAARNSRAAVPSPFVAYGRAGLRCLTCCSWRWGCGSFVAKRLVERCHKQRHPSPQKPTRRSWPPVSYALRGRLILFRVVAAL